MNINNDERIRQYKNGIRFIEKYISSLKYNRYDEPEKTVFMKPSYQSTSNEQMMKLITSVMAKEIGKGKYGKVSHDKTYSQHIAIKTFENDMDAIHEIVCGLVLEPHQNMMNLLGFVYNYLTPRVSYVPSNKSLSSAMIIEYIDGISLKVFLKLAQEHERESVALQLMLSVLELGKKYRFNHNDLHSNNVIVEYYETPVKLSYFDNKYTITTNYVAKIVDLGMSRFETEDGKVYSIYFQKNYMWFADIPHVFDHMPKYIYNNVLIPIILPYTRPSYPWDDRECFNFIDDVMSHTKYYNGNGGGYISPVPVVGISVKKTWYVRAVSIAESKMFGFVNEKHKVELITQAINSANEYLLDLKTIDIPDIDAVKIFENDNPFKDPDTVDLLHEYSEVSEVFMFFYISFLDIKNDISSVREGTVIHINKKDKEYINSRLEYILATNAIIYDFYLLNVFDSKIKEEADKIIGRKLLRRKASAPSYLTQSFYKLYNTQSFLGDRRIT